MTTLQNLNAILKELNTTLENIENISEELIANIEKTNWPELKKEDSICIVRQLSQFRELDTSIASFSANGIYFNSLCLDVFFFDVKAKNVTMNEYVSNLLSDLNQISPIVKFKCRLYSVDIENVPYYDQKCKCYIDWEV